MMQVHDFNPGIGPNGLFWLVQVPDDAVKVTDDTLTISLKDVPVVDQLQFTGGPNNLGVAGIPAKVSFDITYTKSGRPRHVRPISSDPLSPFNWAGEMWSATNSGTFSLAYDDGTLVVLPGNGSFSTPTGVDPKTFGGQVGFERNGSFVHEDDKEMDNEGTMLLPFAHNPTNSSAPLWTTAAPSTAAPALAANSPKFKGRVPLRFLIH